MADARKLQRVPESGDNIISIINDNFTILTDRIKSQNLNFSYLDMMRITKIFNPDTSSSDQAYREFISTCWSVLDNYSGVYLRLQSGVKIKMGNVEAKNGDYLVKLPGGEFLHIKGTNPQVYVPYYTPTNPFQITYTLALPNPDSPPISISVPNVAANNIRFITATIAPNAKLSSTFSGSSPYTDNRLENVRWFVPTGDDDAGQEVLWTHSYHCFQNITNKTLSVSYIYNPLNIEHS